MNNKKENILFALLAVLFMVGAAYSASYNGNIPSDIVTTNPVAGSPPSEAWPSIKETRRALVSLAGFKNVTAASYTATYAQSIIAVSAASGNKTVNLPSVDTVSTSSVSKSYIIIKTDSSANTVTIDPYSIQMIDGASTHTLTNQYESIQIVGNGTTWVSYAHKGIDALTLNGFTAYTSSVNGGIVRRKYDGTLAGTVANATNCSKVGGFTPYTSTTAGGIVVRKYDGTISGDKRSESVACIADVKAANTNGGTFANGGWRTRTINTELYDSSSLVTLNNATSFTLPAGTYKIRASAPAMRVNGHMARLVFSGHTSTIAYGTSGFANSGGSYTNDWSTVRARVVLPSSMNIKLQHKCETTSALDIAMGSASNIGVNEMYSIIDIWKED